MLATGSQATINDNLKSEDYFLIVIDVGIMCSFNERVMPSA